VGLAQTGAVPSAAIKPEAAASPPLRAVVSIPPLQGLIAPIIAASGSGVIDEGASRTLVQVLIPPGESEHGYEIPPSKLSALLQADLVVIVGLGLEPQIEKFLRDQPMPDGRGRTVIRFQDVLGLKSDDQAGHDHAHDHADDHHQCAGDPHLWLDPVMVERLVVAVTSSIAESVKADPARKAKVEAAGAQVRERVLAVHAEYAVTCGSFASKTIVVGHDAWGHLASRYGLETVAIAGLAASEPTPKALERAAKVVREKKLKVVFVEPQLGERAGRRIAESSGAEIRRLDPLGDGDWFKMMEGNLAELKRALGSPSVTNPVAPTK